jgi:hypothetical protein
MAVARASLTPRQRSVQLLGHGNRQIARTTQSINESLGELDF